MIESIQKDILADLQKAIEIMEVREGSYFEELRKLSEHTVENVAVYKDTDAVAIAVLFYSLYKIVQNIDDEVYQELLTELKSASENLQKNNFKLYNRSIKNLFALIQQGHGRVREHLQDVMDAARIKNAHALLQKGLSMGQAAGLMGLSNWDLQQYAGRTTALEHHQEAIRGGDRLQLAMKIFQVQK